MDKGNILKKKIYFLVEEKKKMKEKRTYLEKETIFFAKEKKKGERKGGKYSKF